MTLRFVMMAKRLCVASGRVVWRATRAADSSRFGVSFEIANEPMQRFLRILSRIPAHQRPRLLDDVADCTLEAA